MSIVITKVYKKLFFRKVCFKQFNENIKSMPSWNDTKVFFSNREYKKFLKNGDNNFFSEQKVEFAEDCEFLRYDEHILGATLKYKWNRFKDSQFVTHISFLWHWKNFFFVLKNPFWKSRNVWSGKFSGYSYTWYDSIPDGWQKAFGKQLTEDIHKAFKEDKKKDKHLTWKKALHWLDIKEKYGTLRLYASATENIMNVLEHYEDISQDYCIVCGKSATRFTLGWINYICDDCAKLCNNYSIPFKDEDEYYKDTKAYIEKHRAELDEYRHKEN